MKQTLQIIGVETINATMVKITCIPFTTEQVKMKRPSIMEMAMGGIDMNELMTQAQGLKTQMSTFNMPLAEYLSTFKNKILTKIEVEITPVLFPD